MVETHLNKKCLIEELVLKEVTKSKGETWTGERKKSLSESRNCKSDTKMRQPEFQDGVNVLRVNCIIIVVILVASYKR